MLGLIIHDEYEYCVLRIWQVVMRAEPAPGGRCGEVLTPTEVE